MKTPWQQWLSRTAQTWLPKRRWQLHCRCPYYSTWHCPAWATSWSVRLEKCSRWVYSLGSLGLSSRERSKVSWDQVQAGTHIPQTHNVWFNSLTHIISLSKRPNPLALVPKRLKSTMHIWLMNSSMSELVPETCRIPTLQVTATTLQIILALVPRMTMTTLQNRLSRWPLHVPTAQTLHLLVVMHVVPMNWADWMVFHCLWSCYSESMWWRSC